MTLAAVCAGIADGAAIKADEQVQADVCVVGSGAGGGPVAAVLAAAGARVVVIEEGPYLPPSERSGDLRAMMARAYRDGGQTLTVGNPPLLMPVGRAVGGTTLVNSGTCLRAGNDIFAGWQRDLGLGALAPGALDDDYAAVEDAVGLMRVTPGLAGENARVIKAAADRLGWSSLYLTRNARGCVGNGLCVFGCPAGAKQDTAVAFLAGAHAHGACTYSNTRVERVVFDGRRARGVCARTRGGGALRVTAGTTVLCAGTLHTPLLLAAAGVRNRWLGENLSVHPATAAWGVLGDEVGMDAGVPQSLAIDEWAAAGLMLEGVAGPPAYLALTVPFSGPEHRELMLGYRNVAQFGLMIRDRSRGRVLTGRIARRTGSPLIRYDVGPRDAALLGFGIERLAELLFAAGARRVLLPVAGLPELRDGDTGPLRAVLPLTAARIRAMAFHPLGTARMAASAADGVLDADGRVHGREGLYVADGSAVPGALGVNPQLTIMALAHRLGRHLTKEA